MVDHSHLSNGNSSSACSSADLFAQFGVSALDPSIALATDDDMAESVPVPLVVSPSSDDLACSEVPQLVEEISLTPEVQDVFRAAQSLTQKDRLEAVEERKKNLCLMEFIHSLGFSANDVTSFARSGTSPRLVDDNDCVVLNKSCPALVSPPPSNVSPDAQKVFDVSPNCGLPDLPASSGPSVVSSKLPIPSSSVGPSSSDGVTPPLLVPHVGGQAKSWSEVVAQNVECSGGQPLSLEYFPPASPPLEGTAIVRPPADILRDGNRRWVSCLVGGFSNAKLPFKMVESTVHKLWDKFGLQKVFLQEKGYFVFKFSSTEDRDRVLASGPWYIANKLLILKLWKEGIDIHSDQCSKLPVWVKLHHVPMSYWSAKGLSFIASAIGKPLMADKVTDKLEPMPFARICIEVSSDSSFPSKLEVVVLDEETNSESYESVVVEYQNKPQLCPHCKFFGHSLIRCPRANYKWVPKASLGSVDLPPKQACSVPPPAGVDQVSLPIDPVIHTTLDCLTTMVASPLPAPAFTDSADPCAPPLGLASVSSPTNLSNSFSPLISPDQDCPLVSPSPSPNPLRDRLKLVDEVAVKELNAKGRKAEGSSMSSKKKSKRGGGGGGRP